MSKNLSKLTKKVITDKNGKRKTVWVKNGKEVPAPKASKEMSAEKKLEMTKKINSLKEKRNKLPAGHSKRAGIQKEIDDLTAKYNPSVAPSASTKKVIDDKNMTTGAKKQLASIEKEYKQTDDDKKAAYVTRMKAAHKKLTDSGNWKKSQYGQDLYNASTKFLAGK